MHGRLGDMLPSVRAVVVFGITVAFVGSVCACSLVTGGCDDGCAVSSPEPEPTTVETEGGTD